MSGIQRRLRRRHPLHLQRRRRLRRPDRGRLDLGAVVTGAPGIGGPAVDPGHQQLHRGGGSHSAADHGGIYPNGRDTTWWIAVRHYDAPTEARPPARTSARGPRRWPITGLSVAAGPRHHLPLPAGCPEQPRHDVRIRLHASPPPRPRSHGAPLPSPHRSFTAVARSPTPGSSRASTPAPRPDAGDTITDYSWDFGDGTTADTQTTATIGHSYTTRGAYNVTLTVTNSVGQTDTSTETVRVDVPPTAAYNPSATVTGPGSTVSFDGTPSAPGPGGTITDYSWNFGDGRLSIPAPPRRSATLTPRPASTRSG